MWGKHKIQLHCQSMKFDDVYCSTKLSFATVRQDAVHRCDVCRFTSNWICVVATWRIRFDLDFSFDNFLSMDECACVVEFIISLLYYCSVHAFHSWPFKCLLLSFVVIVIAVYTFHSIEEQSQKSKCSKLQQFEQ